ncbi:hypothetical protein PVAP13_1NG406119 [Panicum virgatum]|uniref:Uncharacterized protein n=1 Tax=Panicum virgatum TaxID=38727 RepID=A0A8T0X575_PANVG|nr:hypothetical protein PVAP13_1NG406119 [Panicum virgatum]
MAPPYASSYPRAPIRGINNTKKATNHPNSKKEEKENNPPRRPPHHHRSRSPASPTTRTKRRHRGDERSIPFRSKREQAAADSILPPLSDRNQTKMAKSIPRQTQRYTDLPKAPSKKVQGTPFSPARDKSRRRSSAVAATTRGHRSSVIDLDNEQNLDLNTNSNSNF